MGLLSSTVRKIVARKRGLFTEGYKNMLYVVFINSFLWPQILTQKGKVRGWKVCSFKVSQTEALNHFTGGEGMVAGENWKTGDYLIYRTKLKLGMNLSLALH